jgi:hypothetical protein
MRKLSCLAVQTAESSDVRVMLGGSHAVSQGRVLSGIQQLVRPYPSFSGAIQIVAANELMEYGNPNVTSAFMRPGIERCRPATLGALGFMPFSPSWARDPGSA